MPQYVIERSIPHADRLTAHALSELSSKSCRVLRAMGPQIQWLHSYVTEDRLYCVYRAPNTDQIREHALRGGFPIDSVREVKTVIDPITAE